MYLFDFLVIAFRLKIIGLHTLPTLGKLYFKKEQTTHC